MSMEIQNLNGWMQGITKQMQSANSPAHLREVGEHVIQGKQGGGLRIRTRLGYGVNEAGGQKSRLKPLTARYIEYRKVFKGLSSETRPGKSNLTLTGSMLDSLKVTSVGTNSLTIEPTGTDRKGVSNTNKAAWQQKQGRNFLSLSRQEIKSAREYWVTSLSGLLNK
jgi:hypothetical protein